MVFVCLNIFFYNNAIANISVDGVKIIKSDSKELIISYKPKLTGIDTIYTADGYETYKPRITGCYLENTAAGSPISIVKQINISVPNPDGFTLEDFNVNSFKYINGYISPTPKLVSENAVASEEYFIDKLKYNSQPEKELIKCEYGGISRDRHIAELSINIAQYNPRTNQIEIPEEIYIKVKFNANTSDNFATNRNSFALPFTINHSVGDNWLIESIGSQNFGKSKKSDKKQSLSNGQWFKITVDSEGIYRIDLQMLSSLGIQIKKEEINTIKIFGNGGAELPEKVSLALDNKLNEQSIIVRTKANGDLEEILFYGSPAYGFRYEKEQYYEKYYFKHYINNYSNNNYYLFTWGGDAGKRATPLENPQGEIINTPVFYTHRIFFEEELTNAFSMGSGRTWFGRSIFPATFTNVLENLDRTGEIQYRFSVAHRASLNGYFSIYENNNKLVDAYLNYVSAKDYEDAYKKEETVKIPASQIASDNRSVLRFDYHNNAVGATGFFDWYEIHYPRSFSAIRNELGFFSDPALQGITQFTISNYTGEIFGLEVTNLANPKFLTNNSTSGNLFVFKTDLTLNQPKRFFISSVIKKPTMEKINWGNFRENFGNSEVIFITHPDFIKTAEKYKEYRESQGISVSIAQTDEIFNEFGCGITDNAAIRDFIAFAYHNWEIKPKYVILWGDGHFDFKNIQTKMKNYVPVFEFNDNNSSSYSAIYSYATDDFYGKIVGDDNYVDIGIGRITVDSPELSEWMLEKIKYYETNSSLDSWRTIINLMADDSFSGDSRRDGAAYTNDNETLSRAFIPQDLQRKKLYLVEYPAIIVPGGRRKPKVTEDMLTITNTTGSVLLNWIGHGNPRVWGHEEIFERENTLPLMRNLDKLFFCTAATCDFGRYDMSETRCGAEEMLLSKVGGAIGVFSATRVVWSSDNAEITQTFYQKLFTRDSVTKRYPRLGDVMFAVKQERGKMNDFKFNLLGDPVTRLLIPENFAVIDSINGTFVGYLSDTVKLKALNNITIKGRVLNYSDSLTDDTFNGTAVLSMFDSDIQIKAIDIDNSIHNFVRSGGALNKSSYKVTNGNFTANFIIPKDISFSNKQGKIFLYSYSDDGRFAKGLNDCFTLGGIDTNAIVDTKGPDIRIYLDSRNFLPGDLVSDKPMLIVDLFDESGLNTTGNGIGHRIEAWIDNNPNSIDLTSKFSNSLENPKAGTAEQLLSELAPGNHTIKVRAWDVFNNYSIAETNFRIATLEEGLVISNLINVPNPFSEGTTIRFQHNISGQFFGELRIYDVNGNILNTVNKELGALHSENIYWNGLSKSGESVSSGVYLFVLRITTKDGRSVTKSSTMSLIK